MTVNDAAVLEGVPTPTVDVDRATRG